MRNQTAPSRFRSFALASVVATSLAITFLGATFARIERSEALERPKISSMQRAGAAAFKRKLPADDFRAICAKSCAAVGNPDLRAFCGGNCGIIRDFDTRQLCWGECGSVSDPDLRHFCAGDCSNVVDPDLRGFCSGSCAMVPSATLRGYCAGACGAI